MDAILKAMLEAEGYSNITDTGDVPGVIGTIQRIYTHAICCQLDYSGIGYRYCYENKLLAVGALMDWAKIDYAGDPAGYITTIGLEHRGPVPLEVLGDLDPEAP